MLSNLLPEKLSLFGRVLASACEAQIRLCVKRRQTSLSNSESVKSQK